MHIVHEHSSLVRHVPSSKSFQAYWPSFVVEMCWEKEQPFSINIRTWLKQLVHVTTCVDNVTDQAFAADIALIPSAQATSARHALCKRR
jgi:hypothetical protein